MNEQVLLDKVFDAGANTIWSEMKKLRGHAPEYKNNIRRRWIWELVQNASDCAFPNRGINIIVNYEKHKGELKFIHNGKPFKYANLIDLITQISSKQSDEDKKTGKFGTGFISTHLLSETVKLTSVLHDDDGSMKEFECIIDRSGTEYQDIRENIKKNLNDIEEIRTSTAGIQCKDSEYFTTFTYFIKNEDAKQAVLVGLKDLENAAPYVLSLNPSICSIDCDGIHFKVSSNKCVLNGMYDEIEIEIKIESLCENFTLMCKKQNKVSLVFPVKKIVSSQFRLLPYPKNFPKLFCNFPLIGTEKFSFPILINCADFEVEKDRNAIHEGNEDNIQILKTAKELYFELLDCAAQNKWYDIFNICFCENNVDSQLQQALHKKVFEQIEVLPIVNVNCDGKECGVTSFCTVQAGKPQPQIWIPQIEKMELNDEFWEIVNKFSKFYIPSFSTYKEWGKIFTNKITVRNINDWFLKEKSFLEMDNCCHSDCYEWLNTFYSFWIKSSSMELFYKEAWVLNQNNEFQLVSTLFVDSEIDEELKNILNELGENIRGTLISKQILISTEVNVKSKDNKYIAKRIQDKINKLLSEETVNNVKRDAKTQLTFNKLTNWFLVNPEKGAELFDTLYNKRNMLSTIEENIRRFRIAEKVESKNITDNELDLLLDNHMKIAELLKNCDGLSAAEIKEELRHISHHNDNALEFYERILERTIAKVHQYLTETGLYQIADTVEDWKEVQYSGTVFPAKKEGKELRIVIRPSDYNKIIFYYDQELSALDDTDYELWTDNGNGDTRMITLGDILRTTGITVIPLRKFY